MAAVEDIEVGEEILSRDEVEARYVDWRERVDQLMNRLAEWARDAGGEVARSDLPPKAEDLLSKYAVAPVSLPKLEITINGAFAKVEPFGLWVIGANGRVDIKTRRGVFKLVDVALPFDAPHWRIAGPGYRLAPALSASVFIELLRG